MIRLLLVDDHPLVREGLRSRMSSEVEITVVGEAGSADEALALCALAKPSHVLMDIGMKECNGIELTALLLKEWPHLRVIMLSMHDSLEYAQRALHAGARGYVLKDAPSVDIVNALHAVAGGGTYLSRDMSQRLFRQPTARVQLSARELDMLQYLAEGQSSKHIARTVGISVRTVESHRQSIRRKLNLETQADLIKYAVERKRSDI